MKRIKRVGLGCGGLLLLLTAGLAIYLTWATLPGDRPVPAGFQRNEAHYLTMRDGVRLAVDVWYPPDLAPDQRVPTMLHSTRYGRALNMGIGYRLAVLQGQQDAAGYFVEPFNQAGYAVVLLDARGSGASFGSRPIEWQPAEVADMVEVVDWIVAQPWSDGEVGGWGVSYDGNTAELLAATGHPAVKAVAPQYDDFDPYLTVAYPGGVYNRWLVDNWSAFNAANDANDVCGLAIIAGANCTFLRLFFSSGVKPVDGDDGTLLAAAVAARDNPNIANAVSQAEFRDSAFGASGLSLAEVSPYNQRAAIEAGRVPFNVWVGWLDAGTVDGALSRFLTFRTPQTVVIGPWAHGGGANLDPLLATGVAGLDVPDSADQRLLDFFQSNLRDQDPPAANNILYYTLGANTWRSTTTWPPPGMAYERWYIGPANSLSTTPPADDGGEDLYTVDWTATSGETTRWHTQLNGSAVVYPDRAEEDKKLLTYTSAPLETAVEITANPIITLYVASTATDGAFHVYLEDVAPDGRVTYITEGVFRAIHRRVSDAPPVYAQLGPYHSYLSDDAQPLIAGEVAEITFQLYATSVRFAAGHQIRIAIAGHDASVFARYPADETPQWRLQRHRDQASFIALPLIYLDE